MPADNVLFLAVICLVAVGVCMAFNTSFFRIGIREFATNPASSFGNVIQQFKGVIAGLLVMWGITKIGYWKLRQIAVPLMFLGGFLLLACWFPGIGIEKGGAHRWVRLGMMFQPSELAKIGLIIYLAALMSRANFRVHEFNDFGLRPAVVVSAIYFLLIEREPDLGTAAVVIATALTMMFMAGAKLRHLAGVVGVGLLLVVMVGMRHGGVAHRNQRIVAYLNPESDPKGIGYQVRHARYAVGSGRLLGEGIGQGKEKLYLPQSDSDFVFCTLAEELGFVRLLPILTLYVVVAWRGFAIAQKTKDRFGALLASGVASLISWQAVLNIGVATTLLPATGVPLPFISTGATSLFALMAGIGILLSVSQHPNVVPSEKN